MATGKCSKTSAARRAGGPPHRYRNVITGRCVPAMADGTASLRAADVFEQFPIAVLVSEPA